MTSRVVIVVVVGTGLAGFLAWWFFAGHSSENASVQPNLNSTNMQITSSAFAENQKIPEKYTCQGEDVNPPFEFSDVPKATKSLVLIVDDPDAPGGLWTHWTVWNIQSQTRKIKENSLPENSVAGATSANRTGYHGPCPPSGTHRYVFHLLALDTVLNLSPQTQPNALWRAVDNHLLAQATLTGLYSKD